MSYLSSKPGTGTPGGDGVLFGGAQTGFTNGMIQYIAQDGTQGGDLLAMRNNINGYTEIAREYNSTALDKQFTGTGFDNLNVDSINNQVDTTVTIDSQDNFAGIFSGSTTSNDASVNYAAYTGQRPIQFTFGIDATNDDVSTGSGGFTGTPINGEVFNDGLGNSFKFISYDIGTDTIYAYAIVGNVVGTYTGINSGATVTLVNTFTTGSSEVGIWTDSLGNNGVWSIAITVPYTIGTGANTLDVTLTSNGHNNGDFWSTTFFTGGVIYDVQSQSGALTQGETLTGSLGTTATFAFQYSGGGQQIILTNIVGSLSSGNIAETFTGSVSGNTVLFNNPITYVDTYTATDGVSTITQIPTESESNQSLFGNITINWGSETGHNVGDQWVIAFVPVTITTGYETNQIQFPNVPFGLEGSAMVATDGTDKAAVGVFDLSPFGGQDKLTSGILALYGDGSQSKFTQNKGSANLNVSDVTTNKTLNINYTGDGYELSGFNGSTAFAQTIDGNSFRYQTNGNNFTLPTQVNGAGYVVTDVNGDGVLTLEPGGGGTIPGNNFEVVISDGTGSAITTSNFQYNYSTLTPTILTNEGIYYNPATRFAFLGDNNTLNNGNYIRVNDTANEIVVNINPAGTLSMGDFANSRTRIAINASTDVIDNYTQNGWNLRDFSGTNLIRANISSKQVAIGDPGNQSTGFWSNLDVTNATYQVGVSGSGKNFLYINIFNGVMKFGDPDSIFTGTSVVMDTASGDIFNIATRDYIVMDLIGNRLIESNLPGKDIIIGDVSNVANNVKQTIINSGINAQYFVSGFNFGQGIFADFANKLFVLGDKQGFVGNGNKVVVDDGNQTVTVGGGVNGTSIVVNDAQQRIEFNSTNGEYRMYNLVAFADDAAAGGAGAVTGTLYQTDGTGAAPLNVPGIVMIKQ